jgi:hypothetical protein
LVACVAAIATLAILLQKAEWTQCRELEWTFLPVPRFDPMASAAAFAHTTILRTPTDIPKIMWSYWVSDTPSTLNQACIATWRWFNPEFAVIPLTRSTLGRYLPDLARRLPSLTWIDSPARESDVVRMHLMAAFGGVWMDGTILALGPHPLKALMGTNKHKFLGYMGSPGRRLYWESWCFAAVKGEPFVAKLKDMFMATGNFPSIAAFLNHIRFGLGFTILSECAFTPNYLLIYVCAQYVYNRALTPTEKAAVHLIQLTREGEHNLRPRLNMASTMRPLVERCKQAHEGPQPPPPSFIKLCGGDRKLLTRQALDATLAMMLPPGMPFTASVRVRGKTPA